MGRRRSIGDALTYCPHCKRPRSTTDDFDTRYVDGVLRLKGWCRDCGRADTLRRTHERRADPVRRERERRRRKDLKIERTVTTATA